MSGVDEILNQPTHTPAAAPVKRDRYGRYLIPDPDTGKERPWTRATTLAGTLADRFGLEQWAKRNVVLGLGARADLYAQAASCTPDDKGTLNEIVAQAEEASKAKAKANLGTALHRFTERVDAGETITPPAPWDADVAAYRTAMGAHGVAVVPEWIERILIVPELGVAGTCDRLCNAMAWPLPRISDLKTGADVLRYSMPEIAIQLSLYAHATHWYDPATGNLHEITVAIDRDTAVVMHLPVGKATCQLYAADIAAGWDMARTATAVREWRKRRDLAELLVPIRHPQTTGNPPNRQTPSGSTGQALSRENGDQPAAGSGTADTRPEGEPAAGPTPALTVVRDDPLLERRVAWLRNRIGALTPSARLEASKTWPDDTPRKAADLTDHGQVDRISRCLWAVEGAHGIAFPDPDPGDEQPEPAKEVPVTEPKPDPAVTWADRGKALLSLLDDEPLARACAELAGCHNTRMNQLLYEQLQAVVTQQGDPAGVIRAMWHGADPAIEIVDQAEQIMAQAHGGTKQAALQAARNAARHHGLPIPKSLHDAASDPLLAALVASATNTTQETQ